MYIVYVLYFAVMRRNEDVCLYVLITNRKSCTGLRFVPYGVIADLEWPWTA